MMPICFVDTETTGLHQDKQLWEVAIIRRDLYSSGDAVESRYEAFVPVDLSNADLFGLNVGRFYERHPMGRYLAGQHRDESWVYEDEIDLMQKNTALEVARMTHGARFIGAAPSFDAEVLGDFLRKHGLLPTWHHRLVDTHDLAIGDYVQYHKSIGTPKSYEEAYALSKDELSRHLGLKPHNDPKLVHTAMGDAQHEADIWDAIFG